MVFISMNNINKTFNGIKALNNVNLSLAYGEVLCLAGQNGCGKSTLIKILSGVYQPDLGAEINIAHRRYARLSPQESINQGIQVIYQDLALFPNLTVAENIAINRYRKLSLVRKQEMYQLAQQQIEQIGAALNLDALVEDLSTAQQQIVAICRALAQNAKLLIMDEPTASLTAKEVARLLQIVLNLKRNGISIIFVSHKLNEVMRVSDNVLILKDGEIVGKYPINAINEEQLAYLMTGIKLKQQCLAPFKQKASDILLKVENLSRQNQYANIHFSLRKGEIISLIGLLGSGRTELCLSLFGITQPDEGRILMNNKEIHLNNNRDAIRHKIAYVSEDRTHLGLIMQESIHHNMIATIFDKIRNKWAVINRQYAYALTEDLACALNIKAPDIDQPVNTLSGGNAQRVAIAKWLAIEPQLIILDSPTIGVDIANKAGIFNIIHKLAEQGIAVILITDELKEAYFHSHRILVMRQGRIVKEFTPQNATEEEIYKVIYESNEQ